ncbi:hypothetical protein QOT17_015213 [Balamuthia mandrillaris]
MKTAALICTILALSQLVLSFEIIYDFSFEVGCSVPSTSAIGFVRLETENWPLPSPGSAGDFELESDPGAINFGFVELHLELGDEEITLDDSTGPSPLVRIFRSQFAGIEYEGTFAGGLGSIEFDLETVTYSYGGASFAATVSYKPRGIVEYELKWDTHYGTDDGGASLMLFLDSMLPNAQITANPDRDMFFFIFSYGEFTYVMSQDNNWPSGGPMVQMDEDGNFAGVTFRHGVIDDGFEYIYAAINQSHAIVDYGEDYAYYNYDSPVRYTQIAPLSVTVFPNSIRAVVGDRFGTLNNWVSLAPSTPDAAGFTHHSNINFELPAYVRSAGITNLQLHINCFSFVGPFTWKIYVGAIGNSSWIQLPLSEAKGQYAWNMSNYVNDIQSLFSGENSDVFRVRLQTKTLPRERIFSFSDMKLVFDYVVPHNIPIHAR